MLFPYKYVNHPIEKLQEYLDHLFLEVWCKADRSIAYDISLLHPVFGDIIEEIYFSEVPYGEYLYEPIGKVYTIFQQIDPTSKAELAQFYRHNNCIENLCCQTAGCEAITYNDLKAYHAALPVILKAFYENLYNKVLNLQVVKKQIGELDDHYIQFVTENYEDKCPFCGINSIKGKYHSKREAYDHYLPKSIYPFNSVNFYNLSPMCHECNSSYKAGKDTLNIKPKPKKSPLRNQAGRKRKAFYIFANQTESLQLKINLLKNDVEALTPSDIEIQFLNPSIQEEIETWKDIFGIEERYKAKCLANDSRYWLVQATDEYDNYPAHVKAVYPREEHLQKLIDDAKVEGSKYACANFIKAEYLEACKRIGVL